MCSPRSAGTQSAPASPPTSSPALFPRATLRLDRAYAKGRAFTITALHAEDPAAIYNQLAKLNDVALDHAWLTHDEITAGGTLEFTLGREPNRTWGLVPPPASFAP